MELTTDEYRIAKNLVFARALGHPSLAALEHYAAEHFPHMAAVSQAQWDKMEHYRQRKSHEQQVQAVADFLVEIDLHISADAVVSAPGGIPVEGIADDIDSAIPLEVEQHTWPYVRSIANHEVRNCPARLHAAPADKVVAPIEDLEALCEEVDMRKLCSRREFFIFEYKLPYSAVSLEEVFNELSGSLEAKSPLLCVGLHKQTDTESHVLVLLRSGNYSHIKPEMLLVKTSTPIRAMSPQLRGSHPRQRQEALLRAIQQFTGSVSTVYGNLALVEVPGEWTTESLLHLFESVTDEKLLKIVGDARLTKAAERTELQTALLTNLSILQQLRRQSSASDPLLAWFQRLRVAEWIHFQYLDHQACKRFDEDTGVDVEVSLLQYIKDPSLHLAHALGVFGADHTTGWGKSQICNRFVLSVAACKSDIAGVKIPPIVTNTLDGARRHRAALAQGAPIHFQDCRFSDTVQVQYVSTDLIKAALDVREGGVVHIREEDLVFPPETVRVWSANVSSFEEFVGATVQRVPNAAETMKRRMWVCWLSCKILTARGKEHLVAQTLASHDPYRRRMAAHFP